MTQLGKRDRLQGGVTEQDLALFGMTVDDVLNAHTSKKQCVRCLSPNFRPTLAHAYTNPKTGKPIVNPTGWYASEKLDGERAVWNGEELLTRNGNKIAAPSWFIEALPKGVALDGELHRGRGNFQKAMSCLRKKVPVDEEWRKITYSVFDVPSESGTFEQRLERLISVFRKEKIKATKHLRTCYQTKVESASHLDKFAEDLVSKGAEGVIIRDPSAPYEERRTKRLLKVKPSFDAECQIVGYKPGTGKYEGLLGAFECVMVDDHSKRFFLSGMDDQTRRWYQKTHPVGTVVTYKYSGLTNAGLPRHPQYWRVRA